MDELDDLFAQGRAEAMQPSDALMQRVLADAARLQPRPAALAPRAPVAPPRPGFWAALAGFFGGGAALAGIGSAALVGMFLGFAQPAAVLAMASDLTSTQTLDTLDLMPGVDALLAEE